MLIRRRALMLAALALAVFALAARPGPARSGDVPVIRLGLLEFGTGAWEADTIRRYGLDQANGFLLEIRRFASNDAGRVAFQAKDVDAILTDLLWAGRVKAEGRALVYVPFSSSEGALMVPAGSPVKAIVDLKGRKVGIGGGPLDKSFLMLRAQARKEGLDLEQAARLAFGAPPLIAEKLRTGELDAALLYWTYAARLQAEGFMPLIPVRRLVEDLGVPFEPALVGYVFDGGFAATDGARIDGFAKASRAAKAILASPDPKVSDPAWEALRPLMKAENEAIFRVLREGFVAGIPRASVAEEEEAARLLFSAMARIGGARLVGAASRMPEHLYWRGREGGL